MAWIAFSNSLFRRNIIQHYVHFLVVEYIFKWFCINNVMTNEEHDFKPKKKIYMKKCRIIETKTFTHLLNPFRSCCMVWVRNFVEHLVATPRCMFLVGWFWIFEMGCCLLDITTYLFCIHIKLYSSKCPCWVAFS